MSADSFANICVGLAGGLYFAASIGYWIAGSKPLGMAFLCYAIANGCIVLVAMKALGR